MIPSSVREQLRAVKPASEHINGLSVIRPERIAAIDRVVNAAKLSHPECFVSDAEEKKRLQTIDLNYLMSLRD